MSYFSLEFVENAFRYSHTPLPFNNLEIRRFRDGFEATLGHPQCIYDGNRPQIAYTFCLSSFPGSPQLLVSSGVCLIDSLRHKGYGGLLLKWRIGVMQQVLNSQEVDTRAQILALVRDDNVSEVSLLKQHSWKKLPGKFYGSDFKPMHLWKLLLFRE